MDNSTKEDLIFQSWRESEPVAFYVIDEDGSVDFRLVNEHNPVKSFEKAVTKWKALYTSPQPDDRLREFGMAVAKTVFEKIDFLAECELQASKALVEPQRQWVGLTNDEIALIDLYCEANIQAFARAIEAKLKEKNNRGMNDE